jgi:ABC-type multidrug transport system fused ATPase/permease subunit
MAEIDKLEIFLNEEYKKYVEYIRMSYENRDKYFRMYVVLISALIVFLGNTFMDNGLEKKFLIMLGILSITIFLVSYITGAIVLSARRGNVDAVKRVNIIRGLLRILSSEHSEKLDNILLPVWSSAPKYFSEPSVDAKLLFLLSLIMSLSSSAAIFSVLMIFLLVGIIDNISLLVIFLFPFAFIIFLVIGLCYIHRLDKYEKEQFGEVKEQDTIFWRSPLRYIYELIMCEKHEHTDGEDQNKKYTQIDGEIRKDISDYKTVRFPTKSHKR